MTPQDALIHFPLTRITKITPISVGLVHATYKITAREGTFILQKTHPLLSSPGLLTDYDGITSHIASHGEHTQRLIKTIDGTRGIIDDEDSKRMWRVLSFVPGSIFTTLDRPSQARAAGRATARFHATLASYKKPFKSKLAFHPYDVPKFYKDFARVVKKFSRDSLMEPVRDDVDFLLSEIPKLMLPNNLPSHVVHGDLKINNFVFDDRGRDVVAIIDLDTCARFPVLYELGDALRSWCGGAEDDPRNTFNKARYSASVAGYVAGAPHLLSARERKLIPRAVKLLILNLASRFLKDYFEDFYFGFDARSYNSRREANLARARGQIALYRSAVKKL